MKRLSLLFLPLLFLWAACDTDLAWEGEKDYAPATTKIYVEDLGIEDSVDVLPAGVPFSVARAVTNTGSGNASGYEVREEILQYVFQAAGGSAGWVPGDPDTHIVFSDSVQGPALGANALDSVRFSIPSLPCGLYEEILTLDSDDDLDETSERNNEGRHFFFVPSTQQFNINVVPVAPAIVHTAGRTNTHNFTITPAGAPGWIYGHFSFVATEGSTADTVPVPPDLTSPPLIRMFVTPREHNFTSGFEPSVTGKITVISQDGCVIKQETAKAIIEHS